MKCRTATFLLLWCGTSLSPSYATAFAPRVLTAAAGLLGPSRHSMEAPSQQPVVATVSPAVLADTAVSQASRNTHTHAAVVDDWDDLTSAANQNFAGGSATIPAEVFNLIKSIVGAGVLSLPYGVAAFGNHPSALWPATILIAGLGAVSAYTFGLIGRLCQSTRSTSYSEAWEAIAGPKLSWLIAISCVVDCFAGNLSYSMILADTVQNLAASAGFAVSRTNALLGITTFVLLPLCFLKNLNSLAPFSLLGIIGMLYTFAAMAVRYFGHDYVAPTGQFYAASALSTPVFGNAGWQSVFTPKALILMCMLSNAYIAHFNAPKFLSELKNNTMARFHQVIAWSFGASVLLYAGMTALGFLTFGQASNGLILNNYATSDTWMSWSRIAVAVSITCSYPLIFVGTRDGLLDLFRVSPSQRTDGLYGRVTILVLAVITALASQLTDLGKVASVGGATFGTALVFIYPVILFLLQRRQQEKSERELNVPGEMKQQQRGSGEVVWASLVGILGVTMSVIGTVLSVRS